MYTQQEKNMLEGLFNNFLLGAFDTMENRRFTTKEYMFFSEAKRLAGPERSYIDGILQHPVATTPYEDLPLFINNESALADMIVTWRLDIGK